MIRTFLIISGAVYLMGFVLVLVVGHFYTKEAEDAGEAHDESWAFNASLWPVLALVFLSFWIERLWKGPDEQQNKGEPDA